MVVRKLTTVSCRSITVLIRSTGAAVVSSMIIKKQCIALIAPGWGCRAIIFMVAGFRDVILRVGLVQLLRYQ